jgi:hypothetical protein
VRQFVTKSAELQVTNQQFDKFVYVEIHTRHQLASRLSSTESVRRDARIRSPPSSVTWSDFHDWKTSTRLR